MKNGLELGAVITWPQCVEIEKNQAKEARCLQQLLLLPLQSRKQVGKNVAGERKESTLWNATPS